MENKSDLCTELLNFPYKEKTFVEELKEEDVNFLHDLLEESTVMKERDSGKGQFADLKNYKPDSYVTPKAAVNNHACYAPPMNQKFHSHMNFQSYPQVFYPCPPQVSMQTLPTPNYMMNPYYGYVQYPGAPMFMINKPGVTVPQVQEESKKKKTKKQKKMTKEVKSNNSKKSSELTTKFEDSSLSDESSKHSSQNLDSLDIKKIEGIFSSFNSGDLDLPSIVSFLPKVMITEETSSLLDKFFSKKNLKSLLSIWTGIKKSILKICFDKCGNTNFQLLIKYLSKSKNGQMTIMTDIAPIFVKISCHKYGRHVVQYLNGILEGESLVLFDSIFTSNFNILMDDIFGICIIKVYITNLGCKDQNTQKQFISTILEPNLLKLLDSSQHKYGVSILNRALSTFGIENCKRIVKFVAKNLCFYSSTTSNLSFIYKILELFDSEKEVSLFKLIFI